MLAEENETCITIDRVLWVLSLQILLRKRPRRGAGGKPIGFLKGFCRMSSKQRKKNRKEDFLKFDQNDEILNFSAGRIRKNDSCIVIKRVLLLLNSHSCCEKGYVTVLCRNPLDFGRALSNVVKAMEKKIVKIFSRKDRLGWCNTEISCWRKKMVLVQVSPFTSWSKCHPWTGALETLEAIVWLGHRMESWSIALPENFYSFTMKLYPSTMNWSIFGKAYHQIQSSLRKETNHWSKSRKSQPRRKLSEGPFDKPSLEMGWLCYSVGGLMRPTGLMEGYNGSKEAQDWLGRKSKTKLVQRGR